MSNHYVEQANLKRFPIETFSLVHFLLNTSFESFLTYQIPFIPSPIINFIEQKSRIRDNQSKFRLSNSKLTSWLSTFRQSWWGFCSPYPQIIQFSLICILGSCKKTVASWSYLSRKIHKFFYCVTAWYFQIGFIYRNIFILKGTIKWHDQKKIKTYGILVISCSVSPILNMK